MRANVLGVGIDTMPMDAVAKRLFDAVDARSGGYVCATGVHGVMEAQHDASLKAILNRSLLTVPDGVPTVWMGRWQGHRTMERVYGPDLMLEICRRSAETGHTHFLYGGGPGVAKELARRLTARFPGLRVVGTYEPPFRPLSAAEERDLSNRVAVVRPDFMWVGLSTPKQERFMAAYCGRFASTVMLGVGAAFDMHSGRATQAPRWMQVSGLEWLFRLFQEPRRLFWRYASNNPAFMGRALMQITGIRRHVLPRSEYP